MTFLYPLSAVASFWENCGHIRGKTFSIRQQAKPLKHGDCYRVTSPGYPGFYPPGIS